MEVLVFLVPLALLLGLFGLLGFLWSLKNGQYDDLEGAAWRAISDDDETPTPPGASSPQRGVCSGAVPVATAGPIVDAPKDRGRVPWHRQHRRNRLRPG